MAFTLVCHACGQKLTLFDIDVKKRKGTIRCTRCGAHISYDLDKRNIQQSGFWATEEPVFDARTKNRMMKQIEREEKRKALMEGKEQPPVLQMETNASHVHDFDNNPFSAKAGFAKFDLKTGEIISDTPSVKGPEPPKVRQERKDEITFKTVDRSHQKRTIHATGNALPDMKKEAPKAEGKTFTPPPRIVTRTAHRNMQLVRQAQAASKPKAPVQIAKSKSLWQRIKSFFTFIKHS